MTERWKPSRKDVGKIHPTTLRKILTEAGTALFESRSIPLWKKKIKK